MSVKLIVGLVLAALAIGVLLGYRLMPAKTVEIEKEVVKNNVVTKIVERKDGSKETTITDTSTIKKDSTISTAVLPPKKTLTLSATATSTTDLKPIYGILVQKVVLAPLNISVGLGLNTDKQALLTVGMEF